jgi:hypothetical protein
LPFRSGETGSVGKQVQDRNNGRIVRGLFQRSKFASQLHRIEIEERKSAEGDKTMENFDLEVQLKDLMIFHDDTSEKLTDTWKTGLELHEDESSIFSSFDNKFDN